MLKLFASVETASDVIARIDSNMYAAESALVYLYRQQTAAERLTRQTTDLNGRGFNMRDAKFGSSLAQWVISGRHLTPNQLAAGRKMLHKYAGQILRAVAAAEMVGTV